jgi:aryl-alcohol dehydrogenase-like predicted oxidoreductase
VRQLEDSLRRLGTDYVDLYWLNHPGVSGTRSCEEMES